MGCSENIMKKYESIETISIDIRKSTHEADITSIIDTSYFEIIPLETNEECLISEVSRIHLYDNKIIIYDERMKGIYIFNRDGSYHAKVRNVGQGPGEYPPGVNDMMVSNNLIGVLVPPFGIMLYDFNGKFIKKISLEGTWGSNLFTFDGINYFLANDWSDSDKGLFLLFRIDTKQNRIFSYLKFSKKDIEVNRGWDLEKYYNLYDNRALLYYSTIDTIFNLTPNGEISEKYAIDIVYKQLPEVLRKGDGDIAIESSIENEYIKGITNISETSRYLVLKLDGGKYSVIYDKKEKKNVHIATFFKIPSFFDLSTQLEFSVDKDDFILSYVTGFSASGSKDYINEMKENKTWKKGDGTSSFEKEFFRVLENVKDEEDNPIVFILKMKE